MKLETTGDGQITLKEVYNSIRFVTEDGIELFLCMRDGGFEFKYAGRWYRVNDGKVLPLPKSEDHGLVSS